MAAGLLVVLLASCEFTFPPKNSSISKAVFGKMPGGQSVEIYTLRNAKGAGARIMTYGGIVQSLTLPDRNGKVADVVLGYDTLQGYVDKTPYFGALIGRYGNRIGAAKFSLDGRNYTLATNSGPNSLHGGLNGFDKVVWRVESAKVGRRGPELELTYLSPDGEEGFPGNLKVRAVYTLTDDNELKVEFSATTDKATVVNLTHHSYFNLAGQGNGDILGHVVYINSDKITPVDAGLITTGEFADVTGTPFDFRKPTPIGTRISDPDRVLQYGPGFDHNWVINKPPGHSGLMARVVEPICGRVMEVWSDEPGLQFYAGNFLDGTLKGKGGVAYQIHTGFCMEPQHYPDSPNKPNFPSVVLRPGQIYHNTISYKFSAE